MTRGYSEDDLTAGVGNVGYQRYLK